MMPSSSRMLCSSSTTRTRASAMMGNPEGEGAAAARGRLDIDLAAVVLEDPVNQGEPETAATRLGREEWLEDMGDVTAADPVAGVFDADDQRFIHGARGDAELAAIRHRLHGVEAEIPDGLAELLRIHLPHERGRELAHDLQRPGRRAMLEEDQDLVDRLAYVHPRPGQRGRSGVLEEVAQDGVEACGLLEHDVRQSLAQF